MLKRFHFERKNMTKIIVFDMTGVLIDTGKGSLVDYLNKFCPGADEIWREYLRGKIPPHELSVRLAEKHKGLTKELFESIIKDMGPTEEAKIVVEEVKKRGYIPAIVSAEYMELVEKVAKELSIDEYYGNQAIFNNGVHTGKLKRPIIDDEEKERIALKLKRKYNADKLVAIGDDRTNVRMLKVADFSIAYNSTWPELEKVANVSINGDLIEILKYL